MKNKFEFNGEKMVYFWFGNFAFNCGSSESTINIVLDAKVKYDNPEQFLYIVTNYIDDKVNPGYGIKEEYAGAILKEGKYYGIIKKWLDSMNEKIEVRFDDIQNTWRIKKTIPDPISDEFVLETADEYILFLWTTSA